MASQRNKANFTTLCAKKGAEIGSLFSSIIIVWRRSNFAQTHDAMF